MKFAPMTPARKVALFRLGLAALAFLAVFMVAVAMDVGRLTRAVAAQGEQINVLAGTINQLAAEVRGRGQ